MGLISLDFQSIVIGYAVGVALMWSIHELLYGDNDEQETDCKDINSGIHHGHNNVYSRSP